MADILAQYALLVTCHDIADPENRGWGGCDFRTLPEPRVKYDWLITNPPFKLAELFIRRAPAFAKRYAILARLSLLESKGRYERIWKQTPPSEVMVFVNRVSFRRGRLAARTEGSATCFAWFVWNGEPGTSVKWIDDVPIFDD